MHEHSHKLSLEKSPCVQIMFNINSKNCVNNNIVADIQKPFHLDMYPNDATNKNDKTVVLSSKKYPNHSNQKSNNTTINKSYINSSKPADLISQQNCKSNNKNIKINKTNSSVNQTQKSIKNTNLHKNTSGTFTKTNLNQQIYTLSQKKAKKSKTNTQKSKLMRQKIIQLMIKDYQNGKISVNNLKVAISSLIQKQSNDNKTKSKLHSKTQKSRIHIPNSYKSTVANSLRNTPKNIPAKSKSEKMYQHSFIKFGKKINQFDEQPEIIQRVIDRKDFTSKIVIKGINSSLFLSNEWTTNNDSPKRESTVNVNVINTSDSVKDMKKQMQKLSYKNVEENINFDHNIKLRKVQKALDEQKNSETQQLLNYYISEFQRHQNKNQKESYIFQNFEIQKELTAIQRQNFENSFTQQKNYQNQENVEDQSFGQFEIRQLESVDKVLNLHQNQQNEPHQIRKKVVNESSKNENYQQNFVFQQSTQQLKSYMSSQLKNRQKKYNFSTSKKQELSQKRVKSFTENEIKRLNQVLDVIKGQISSQNNHTNKIFSQQQILINLASLIEKQKNKASQQLKLYHLFNNEKKQAIQQKNTDQNGENIDQNQIINSFKKKLYKKPLNGSYNNSPQKIHFQSIQNKSISLQKSFSSLSSNHLSKTKISQLNFDQIQIGLCTRLHEIELKRQQEISVITEKFINDRITPKEYHEEKEIIQKWFLVESNKLKKTKKYLIEGYKKAKDYLLKDEVQYETKLTKQKSSKMIKCISQKYLSKKSAFADKSENEESKEVNNMTLQEYNGYEQNQQENNFTGDQVDQLQLMQEIQLIHPQIDSEVYQYFQSYNTNDNQDNDSGQEEIQNTSKIYYNHLTIKQDESQQNDTQSIEANQSLLLIEKNNKNIHNNHPHDLITLQQPQHLNIVINKRPSSAQEDQQLLFSPKKYHHHQQFSQELLQYVENDQEHSLSFEKSNHQFTPTIQKLKQLNQQDKDDIFQFLFLDLCLEIYVDQHKNSKITKSMERYISYLRKKKTIPKGFKTGLDVCKVYINHIETYIQENYFKALIRLQSPIGPSAKQMLKFMRDYDDQNDSKSSQSDSVGLVLPIQIYEKFQLQPINTLKVDKYYDDDQRQQGRIKFLINLKRFHTKAYFDSLNQMLDLQRNFGIWGKPFPWKKTLSIERKLSQAQMKQKLSKSSQKVIQNCSYLCGVMLDKQDSIFGKTKISQEYLNHIRQDRMSKMLSNDMLDNEERWIFYDDEEVQVLISISKSVITALLLQAIQDISLIIKGKNH